MDDLTIAAVDIGSPKTGKLGWAVLRSDERSVAGKALPELTQALSTDLQEGRPVALGFEAPMWVPLRQEPMKLTAARDGDVFVGSDGKKISRPWSAGAGSGALTTGIVVVSWILRELREGVPSSTRAFLDWDDFVEAGAGLFLWEAFVTGSGKGADHSHDALRAAKELQSRVKSGQLKGDAEPDGEVFSLLGAALVRTSWPLNIRVLEEAVAVVRV